MIKSNNLTDYEKLQVTAIKAWKNKKPGVASRAVDCVTYPVIWLIQKTIPITAIQHILDAANLLALEITDLGGILDEGGVSKICDLKNKNLELSDKIANKIHNWAIGLAVTEGGVTGTAGVIGLLPIFPLLSRLHFEQSIK